MAADADTPDGELSETGQTEASDAPEDGNADNADVEHYDSAVADAVGDAAPAKKPMSAVRLATLIGLVMVVALSALVGWLGFRAYEAYQADQQRTLFLQVGRQGALNLTTIDWQKADTDVKRILDSSTGTFYDDFSKRSQAFIDLVKKVQTTSSGTISEAGLESESGDEAQVLVAVRVETSNLGEREQEPRNWRIRISVQKVGDEMKVANVVFVP